ncbi:MAG: Ku protein [Steroidobacteraceae bacterium]
MPRALWKGAISFSLVHIPVSLYPAAKSSSLDLDLLDKRDFAPIGFRRYNKATNKTVEWKDIVKGYQHRKGEYVVLTDEDFRRANVKATQTIDIEEFVEAEQIPPYFFETPYFVVPEAKSSRVYRLLHSVLQKSKKYAIASVVIRTRQSMVALLPVGDMLLMNTLRYASELQPAIAIDEGSGSKPSPKELQMAQRLVDGMSEKWKPEKFHDSYIDDLKRRIAEKVKARQSKVLTAPEPASRKRSDEGRIVDLMSVLEESLSARKTGSKRAPRRSSKGTAKPASHSRRRKRAA